jgi:hypothetical protein
MPKTSLKEPCQAIPDKSKYKTWLAKDYKKHFSLKHEK